MVGHGKGVSSSVWECRSYPQKISEIFFMQICTYFVFFGTKIVLRQYFLFGLITASPRIDISASHNLSHAVNND